MKHRDIFEVRVYMPQLEKYGQVHPFILLEGPPTVYREEGWYLIARLPVYGTVELQHVGPDQRKAQETLTVDQMLKRFKSRFGQLPLSVKRVCSAAPYSWTVADTFNELAFGHHQDGRVYFSGLCGAPALTDEDISKLKRGDEQGWRDEYDDYTDLE